MFSDLNVLQTAMAMANHASQRQKIAAQNLANADTPGFRAKSLADFKTSYGATAHTSMRATRGGHIGMSGAEPRWTVQESDAPSDPNGNSVSVELELVNAANIRSQHNRAMAIYRSSMNMLRTSLGRV